MVVINRLDKVQDRKLEERSYLQFEFFESRSDVPIIRILPFFENIDVEESRRANYIRYQPLSRNSTLLSYTGSESRVFNVNFKITLPNVIEYYDTIFTKYASKYESKIALQKKFFDINRNDNPILAPLKGSAEDFDAFFKDEAQKAILNKLETGTKQGPAPGNGNIGPFTDIIVNASIEAAVAAQKAVVADQFSVQRAKIINTIMYWVNLIRSSCLNNSKNPTLAPPIVRLNHGILYQDIPTVCLDYKINFADTGGYDLKTLLPRVMEFTLNLQEIRVGDFGDYDVRSIIKRDNAVGWEAIIGGQNTIDPVRRDIGTDFRKF